MEEVLPKSINSKPEPAVVFFMSYVAMLFIQFHDLGGWSLDRLHLFSKCFHPLIDRHKTKPQDPPNGPKAQAFQVQGQRQAALGWSGRIGFVVHGKKY